MKNLYKLNYYFDQITKDSNFGLSKNSGITANCLEFSMVFMQIMPKTFEIPDFDHNNDKPNYFLMFSFTLQFIEKNNIVELRKSRFSIMGSDTDNEKIYEYKPYNLDYSFKDFIKDKYLELVTTTDEIFFDGKTYIISNEDKVKMLECVQHLDKIFPNEKDIIILDQIDADFYKPNDSQDGILLYQNSCKARQMHILNEKFPEKKSSTSMKTKKI